MTTTNNVASTVNNNLQDALATLINKTVTGADAATSFLQQQVPDVIHQLLVWKLAEAILASTSILLLITIVLLVFWKWYKSAKPFVDAFVTWCLCLSGSIVVGIPVVMALVGYITTILQIWIAPKVWLIEYAAKLLKGN